VVSSDLQQRLNSITQQILSRTRLEGIINKLNLYSDERGRKTQDDLVERMRKDIDVELVRSAADREVTAFNVYYSSKNPRIAQQVTSELTNLFITENLESRRHQAEQTTQFLQSQLGDARQKLAEQEERLRKYKDQYLGELPGQLQSNMQILSGLQSQVQGEQDALGRARQQNTYLQSLLSQYQRPAALHSSILRLPAPSTGPIVRLLPVLQIHRKRNQSATRDSPAQSSGPRRSGIPTPGTQRDGRRAPGHLLFRQRLCIPELNSEME
jgi:polysaccharide biosynthesis transport protein